MQVVAAAVNWSRRLPRHILAVVDWSIDPRQVADALRERSAAEPTVFNLLVPSRLPALDWVGNPHASRPCAAEQLTELERLCRASDVPVVESSVGDPERLPAIKAAIETWPASSVLLFERKRRRFAHPWRLPSRVSRSTELLVEAFEVPADVRLIGDTRGGTRRTHRCAVGSA